MSHSPSLEAQQTRQLWEACFQDGEDFLNVYFEQKFPHALNVTHFDQEKQQLAAAVQLFPHAFQWHEELLKSAYVSGLATAPEFRKQGLASKLLQRSHRLLLEKGYILSFLIPASAELRQFYSKPAHGAYETVSYRREKTLTSCLQNPQRDYNILTVQEISPDLHSLYIKTLQNRTSALLLQPNDLSAALSACQLSGGGALVALKDEEPQALLFYTQENGYFWIRMSCALTQQAAAAILYQCKINHPKAHFFTKTAALEHDTLAEPYVMCRVINVPRFLEIMAQENPDVSLSLTIQDDFDLPENNGTYHLSSGKACRTEEKEALQLHPGALAAHFLRAAAINVELLLDE